MSESANDAWRSVLSSITYRQRPDATRETEAAALAAVYRFLLDQHANMKGGAPSTAQNDPKGDQGERVKDIVR